MLSGLLLAVTCCSFASPLIAAGESPARLQRPALTVTGNSPPGNRAIRDERWRYIEYTSGGPLLLDEVNDPHETKNLAGDPARADAVKQLRARLDRYGAPGGKRAR